MLAELNLFIVKKFVVVVNASHLPRVLPRFDQKIWVANVNRKCTGSWCMRMRLCVSGGNKSEKICKIFRKISFMMNIHIVYVCPLFIIVFSYNIPSNQRNHLLSCSWTAPTMRMREQTDRQFLTEKVFEDFTLFWHFFAL